MTKSISNDDFETYFSRLARTNISSLGGYKPGSQPDFSDTVRISANENNFGTPEPVLDALCSYIKDRGEIHRYPDSDCSELRSALSEKFGLPPEWFIVGNGLDDIINLLALTFFDPGDEVIVPEMSFVVYASAVRMMNATVVSIPMRDDLSIDTDAVAKAVTSRTKMIFLCSPNNPTGAAVSASDFDRLLTELDLLPVQPILVVDQAYFEYVSPCDDCADAAKYLSDHKYITVLRTFSKISALSGLRVGYAIANPQMLSYIYRVRQPYTVNSLAQVAALADISSDSVSDCKDRVRKSVAESRGELERFFADNGVAYVPSCTNFVFAFFDESDEKTSLLAKELASMGIFVRLLRHENAPGGLRFSIGTPEENRRLMDALGALLSLSDKKDVLI